MQDPQFKSSNVHLARIDVLRGVAILLVVAFHLFAAAFGTDRLEHTGDIRETLRQARWSFLLAYPLHYGAAGVSLFFVISGYVIHRSYLRDGQFGWKKYAGKRFWRIYPTYLVVLIALALWMNVSLTKDFLPHLLLVHNFSADTVFSINPSFWSLAVEVQLYALYPLAILGRRYLGIGGILGVAALLSIGWRVGAFLFMGWPGPRTFHIGYSPLALWPDWLLGAYLAETHLNGGFVFRHPRMWLAISGTVFFAGEFFASTRAIHFTLGSIVSAVVLELYISRHKPLRRLSRLLVGVGTCSYSLYLIHNPFLPVYTDSLDHIGFRSSVARLAFGPVFVLALIGVAWLVYHVFEKGGVRLGLWWSGKRRQAVSL